MSKLFRQGKRRILKELVINELASVDFPAQTPAEAILLKRRDPKAKKSDRYRAPDVTKSLTLVTSVEEGHAHLVHIWDDENVGSTGFAVSEGAETSHDHPAVLNEDGSLTILMNEGHDHTVSRDEVVAAVMRSQLSKAARADFAKMFQNDEGIVTLLNATTEAPMPDIDPKAPTQEQLDEVTKRAERAEAIAALPADHISFFKSLEGDEADAFLAKTEAEQADQISTLAKAAADEDPVVYTSTDGTEFRKSADPALVKMAQDRDEDRKEIAKLRSANEDAALTKRAQDTLGDLPGDAKVHKAIVRAIDGIEDEAIRAAAFETLGAGNTAIKAAFDSVGHIDGRVAPLDGSAEAELDTLAKAHAKDKGLSYIDAYDAVSQANPALAKRAIEGK